MDPRVLLPKTYCVCQRKSNGRRQPLHRKNRIHSNTQQRFALILKSETSWILCRWQNHSWNLMEEESVVWFDETVRIVPNNSLQSAVQNAVVQFSKMDTGYDVWSLFWPSALNQREDITYAHVGRQIDLKSDSLSVQTLPVLFSFQCTLGYVQSLAVEIESNGKAHKKDVDTDDPLLHAHLKRQLIGTVLPHSIDRVFVKLKYRTLRLTTIAARATLQASKSPFVMVMPSTRIVIEAREDITRISDCNQANLPHVTELLIRTFQCVKNQIPVPRTFLLSGNPGVGKTYSVKAAYSQCEKFVRMISLRGSELLQTHDSNPARALHREFLKAASMASESVVLLFLDECDALVSMDSVASALATLLDHASEQLVVVGATNRVASIPSWLRRAGRFDCEIPVLPPSAEQRQQVLLKLIREKTSEAILVEDRDVILRISEITGGYVPADLTALLRRAIFLRHREAIKAPRRCTRSLSIVRYLEDAMEEVGASSLRDATLSKPPATDWSDVAGDPGGAKTALRQAIEWPRQKKAVFEVLGLSSPRGVLLHGPPGCSKTTLARAAAGATGVAFLSLNPAQVYASSYVGEAERIVRRSFTLARAAAPCILFFDEVDAIFGAGNQSRGNSAEARVLSTFLNEMDGVDSRTASDCAVLVLGATNRPWSLDSALLRPGRLGDKVIYVPPPDHDARKTILQKQIQGENDIDFEALAVMCDTMTGAEIIGACQAAKMRQLRELLENENCIIKNGNNLKIDQEYVVDAFRAAKPDGESFPPHWKL